ncbi:hypothetical protein C5D36_10275 [Rathayibacter sp. AY1C6]|nr:hypothetical protein C5D36_10275 [Rathayibacter sp. AY1C6]
MFTSFTFRRGSQRWVLFCQEGHTGITQTTFTSSNGVSTSDEVFSGMSGNRSWPVTYQGVVVES